MKRRILVHTKSIKGARSVFLSSEKRPSDRLVDPFNFFDTFAAFCIEFWPIIIVVAFLSDPVVGGLAKIIVKPEQRYAEKAEFSSAVMPSEDFKNVKSSDS